MAIFGYRISSMSWGCITKCASDERSWWVMINRKPKDVIVLSQILWEWQNMWYKAGHLFACHRLLDCKKKCAIWSPPFQSLIHLSVCIYQQTWWVPYWYERLTFLSWCIDQWQNGFWQQTGEQCSLLLITISFFTEWDY